MNDELGHAADRTHRGREATRVILALDTATSIAVVALGDAAGTLRAERAWRAGYRHGEQLLGRIDALLVAGGLVPESIGAIVVGTGPGAFTGLRVGLATAKGLAHGLGRPLVGVSTGEALLAAALAAGARPPVALLLPAGPADRVLVRDGSDMLLAGGREPELLPGGREPELLPGETLIAVDLAGRASFEAVELGERARAGLGEALVRIGAARLAAGRADDLARLVPDYVTLPRGVRDDAGEVAWSRDHR